MRGRSPLLLAMIATGCATPALRAEPPQGQHLAPGMRSVQSIPGVRNASREPWSSDPVFSPAIARSRTPQSTQASSLPAQGVLQALTWMTFHAYQNTLSKIDGPTCGFAPTCSRFALEAVREHGPLGIAYGFGRLMQLEGDIHFYHVHPSGKLADPLSNHTFFLRAPALDAFHTYEDRAHAWHNHVRAMRAWRVR